MTGTRDHVLHCALDCGLDLSGVCRDFASVRAARARVACTREVCLCGGCSRRCGPRRDFCAGLHDHGRDCGHRAVLCRSDLARHLV